MSLRLCSPAWHACVRVPLCEQRGEGKRRAAQSPLGLLRILEGYLTYDNDQVRTYINGTTYSVLSIPSLRVRGDSHAHSSFAHTCVSRFPLQPCRCGSAVLMFLLCTWRVLCQEEARDCGLRDLLVDLIPEASDTFHRHLTFILEQLGTVWCRDPAVHACSL